MSVGYRRKDRLLDTVGILILVYDELFVTSLHDLSCIIISQYLKSHMLKIRKLYHTGFFFCSRISVHVLKGEICQHRSSGQTTGQFK